MSCDKQKHGTERSDHSEIVELVDGEKPNWTDPTTCPYPDCDTRGGQLRIEYHLSEEHGWFLIETDFQSEVLADDREADTGAQATLGEVGR